MILILVHLGIPVVFSVLVALIHQKYGLRSFVAVSGILALSVLAFSYVQENLTLRYAGRLDAGGIETAYLAYSLLLMAVCQYLFSLTSIRMAFTISISTVIGAATILFGSWVA